MKSAYLEKLKYHEGFGKYFLFLNKQSIKDSNNAKLLGVKLLEVMSAIPQIQKFKNYEKLMLKLSSLSNESQDEQLSQLEKIQLMPNRKWWSDEYLDWVIYNTFKLILAIPKSEKQNSRNRNYLTVNYVENMMDINLLMKDSDGHGRIFVPGIIVLDLVIDDKEAIFHKKISAELENVLQVPYKEIRSIYFKD